MHKLGIFIYFGYDIPIKERMEIIKAEGFEEVMLWGAADANTAFTPIAEQHNSANKAGLGVANLHMPFANTNFLWADSLDGAETVIAQKRILEECGALGIKDAVMHISRTRTPPQINELGLSRFSEIFEAAEKSNVKIALENLSCVSYLDYFFEYFGKKFDLGFCYDSGHNYFHCRERNLLDEYGERLTAMHLHDNHGASDEHLLPFDGEINWKELSEQLAVSLKRSGYNKAITMECGKERSVTLYKSKRPEEFLAEAYKRGFKLSEYIDKITSEENKIGN